MKVSVITPFFNGNRFMPDYEEMLSVNENALNPGDVLEVIIVNDSPGENVELSGIHSSKPNWKVIKNERNVGIHASRIHGLQEATGDYVIFLDQDDSLREDAIPTFIECARELAAESGSHICYRVIVANAALEQSDGYDEYWYRTDYHASLVGSLKTYVRVGDMIISPGQCMLAKEMIPREWMTYVVSRNGADDYYLWLLLLDKGIEFFYLDEPLYRHRYTGENISGDTTATDDSTLQFLGYLAMSGFPKDLMRTLERQTRYKAAFRSAPLSKKLLLSIRNIDLCLANIIFKIRSRTRYGFNRS